MKNNEVELETTSHIGRAVGLTNLLRGTSYHADRGVLYFPKDLLSQYKVFLSLQIHC